METTIDYKNYIIEIEQDTFPMNPLENYSMFGNITYNPRSRYMLGDTPMDGEKVDRIARSRDYITIPVFAYVHSGATVKVGESNPFTCPWDSGQSGIVFISRADARKELGIKRITKKQEERIKEYLTGTVETFNQYITGEVYCYKIKDAEGNIIDSCWGYYGDPEKNLLIDDAKRIIDLYYIEKDAETV